MPRGTNGCWSKAPPMNKAMMTVLQTLQVLSRTPCPSGTGTSSHWLLAGDPEVDGCFAAQSLSRRAADNTTYHINQNKS
jgi:hypothetical protein